MSTAHDRCPQSSTTDAIAHARPPRSHSLAPRSKGELKLAGIRLGLGLNKKLKLKPGDVVLLVLGTNVDFIIALMGCIYAGVQVSFANPTYTRTELRHVIDVLNPKLVLTSSPFFKKLAVEARLEPRRLVLMDTETISGPLWVERVMASRDEARLAGDALAARPAPKPTAEQLAAATIFLPWSSGTTGLPKAIEITQRNVVAMLCQLNAIPGAFRLGGRALAAAPFFHAIGLIASVCHNFVSHNRVYILSPFHPVDFCNTIRDKRITITVTVPPMLQAVVNCPGASPDVFKSIEWMGCGAAPLSAELQLKIQEKLGVLIVQGHGQTETTVGAFGMQPGGKEGTIGWPLPGIEVSTREGCRPVLVHPLTPKHTLPPCRHASWTTMAAMSRQASGESFSCAGPTSQRATTSTPRPMRAPLRETGG